MLLRKASILNAAILALFIFNAGGVRLISNSIITIVIIALLLMKIQMNKSLDQRFLLISTAIFSAMLGINYLLCNIGFSPLNHIVYFSYVFSAALLVALYRTTYSDFSLDLRLALMFFACHAFIGFILQFIFEPVNHIQFLDVRDVARVFFYPKVDTFSFIHRNSGLFWEPGVLQLFMNVFLFISLFVHRNKAMAIFAIIIIFSTMSTVGFAIMAVQIVYYFYLNLNKRNIVLLPLYLVMGLTFFWLTAMNVGEKLENKSSSVRMFDMAVGGSLLQEHPLVGVGLNSEHFLNEVHRVGGAFQKVFRISDDELEGKGLTNGFLYLFATLGVPVSLMLLFLLYKQSALPHSFILVFILISSGLSEPIFQTGFYMIFMMFGISTFVGSRRKRDKLFYNQKSDVTAKEFFHVPNAS